MTSGRPSEDPKDPEGLLDVLARLVAAGSPWAAEVEQWRQSNPGRALTEGHRKVLRQERDRAGPRPKLTAADEADVQAIVEAYVAGQRRIIKDSGFVALSSHYADARAILPDARLLAARAEVTVRGGNGAHWKPTPAEVVARRLETYLRDPRNGPAFALRWVLDRTEQDDLPRPPKPKTTPKRCVCGHAETEHVGGPVGGQCLRQDNSGVECLCVEFRPAIAREDPIGARRGPALKPTPPPADVAAKVAELTGKS